MLPRYNLFKVIILLVIIHSFITEAAKIYVDCNAEGNGSGKNWKNAYSDLQNGIKDQKPGDTLFVAEGIYYPAEKGGSRDATFRIGKNVKIYGGYKTGGTSRDWKKYTTILNGDILRDDTIVNDSIKNNENNVYSVVSSNNAANTVLDGFTIRGGYGISDTSLSTPPRRIGGGLNIDAWEGNDTACFSIRNCKIVDNVAEAKGGGIYFKGKRCIVENCFLLRNSISDFSHKLISAGGALAFEGFDCIIKNCQFDSCKASNGGAVSFKGKVLKINGGHFISNKATGNGGGAINLEGDSINCKNVVFENNSSVQGCGGSIIIRGKSMDISACSFRSNSSAYASGAIDFWGDSCSITKSNFVGNTVSSIAGAILFKGRAMCVSDCVFEKNSTGSGNAGAVYFEGKNYTSNNCIYKENKAGLNGGALYLLLNIMAGSNNVFEANKSEQASGGAVYFEGDTLLSLKSKFLKNKAEVYGGAISFMGKNYKCDSTSFTQNEAKNGGALYLYCDIGFGKIYYPGYSICNTDFTSNTADSGGALSALGKGSINKCNYVENSSSYGCAIFTWDHKISHQKQAQKDSAKIARELSVK